MDGEGSRKRERGNEKKRRIEVEQTEKQKMVLYISVEGRRFIIFMDGLRYTS